MVAPFADVANTNNQNGGLSILMRGVSETLLNCVSRHLTLTSSECRWEKTHPRWAENLPLQTCNQVVFYHLLQFSYFQFSSVPILFRFRATARPMFSFRDTVRPTTTQTRPPWHHSVLVQPAIAYACIIR